VPITGVMDFSAWFDVYLGKRWFGPTPATTSAGLAAF
jgi:hypothetical protein